jgi:hypothetical protein
MVTYSGHAVIALLVKHDFCMTKHVPLTNVVIPEVGISFHNGGWYVFT